MSIYDSRSDLQKSIDQYVYVLQIACGEKNPIRRKAFENDVNYALQVTEPYKARYKAVLEHDIFAVADDCDQAVEAINDALAVLRKAGISAGVPQMVENPRLILAECAMTLIDTLRSLNAFDADSVEVFIDDVVHGFDGATVAKVYVPAVKVLVHRYIHDQIPESVVDRLVTEEQFLHEYLKLLP